MATNRFGYHQPMVMIDVVVACYSNPEVMTWVHLY